MVRHLDGKDINVWRRLQGWNHHLKNRQNYAQIGLAKPVISIHSLIRIRGEVVARNLQCLSVVIKLKANRPLINLFLLGLINVEFAAEIEGIRELVLV